MRPLNRIIKALNEKIDDQYCDGEMEPLHGYCAACNGPIHKGMSWTITKQMNRVHADQDRCVENINPQIVKSFLDSNPHYEWPTYA